MDVFNFSIIPTTSLRTTSPFPLSSNPAKARNSTLDVVGAKDLPIFDLHKICSQNKNDADNQNNWYKYFQKQTAFQNKLEKMEKGKTHTLFLYQVYNHNPEYKQNFCYYLYDLTKEEAMKLKAEYEAESLSLMKDLIFKMKNATKNSSAAKKAREKKATKPKSDKPKSERKPRTKKVAIIELIEA